MNDERLHKLLVRAGDDGRAEAELQAWLVVQTAFEQERPAPRPAYRSRAVLALAGLAVVILLAAAAVTTPGAAVASWLRDQIIGTPGVKQSAPALTRLPGGGRLLVASKRGVWVVQGDGSRRLLSGYAGATWSPHGLFLGAWRRHELFALEPGGRVHWSLARSGLIHAADWSPDGFRIAYLSGRSLRVVAGDGTGDSELRRRVRPVPPVWKPHGPHLLLLAAQPRVVDVVATDAHALAWRHELRHAVKSLAWSADGRVAAAASESRVTVLDGTSGRVRMVVRAPRGFLVDAIAFARGRPELAITLRSRDGHAQVITVDALGRHARTRLLFAGAGRFTHVQWSPDDRWLMISWPAANQWLFVRSSRVNAIRAVSNIASQFEPGRRAAAFPRVAGWCCTRGRP